MIRGYRVMSLFCQTCKHERPFNKIAKFGNPQKIITKKIDGKAVRLPTLNPTPNIPDNALLIRGNCMICDQRAGFVTTVGRWQVSHYTLEDLCGCGLPEDHEGLHLQEIRYRVRHQAS